MFGQSYVMRFVLITGEYPPNQGGVADYTWQVVQGLRKRGANVEVIVFREPRWLANQGTYDQCTYLVGDALNPASLTRASRIIERSPKDCVLLVQYVPQMYGLKGMNLGWVMWLCHLKASPFWVMFHEVQVTAPEGAPWKHRLLASITQDMARRLAKRADRCFVSSSPFVDVLEKLTRPGVPAEWLPVPTNLSVEADEGEVNRIRAGLLGDGTAPLVGHFGTYKGALRTLIQGLVDQSRRLHPEWKFVFIGRGSREFLNELEEQGMLPPGGAAATGGLRSSEAACWIKACDVMLQPYPDGASTRRGSLMATLALGKATVSNLGYLSDSLWEESSSLYLAERPDVYELVAAVSKVLNNSALRTRLQNDAARCYTQKFSLERTLQQLETVVVSSGELLGKYQRA
jgi:glycosyltransferase involved in cell wall biosynthesis